MQNSKDEYDDVVVLGKSQGERKQKVTLPLNQLKLDLSNQAQVAKTLLDYQIEQVYILDTRARDSTLLTFYSVVESRPSVNFLAIALYNPDDLRVMVMEKGHSFPNLLWLPFQRPPNVQLFTMTSVLCGLVLLCTAMSLVPGLSKIPLVIVSQDRMAKDMAASIQTTGMVTIKPPVEIMAPKDFQQWLCQLNSL